MERRQIDTPIIHRMKTVVRPEIRIYTSVTSSSLRLMTASQLNSSYSHATSETIISRTLLILFIQSEIQELRKLIIQIFPLSKSEIARESTTGRQMSAQMCLLLTTRISIYFAMNTARVILLFCINFLRCEWDNVGPNAMCQFESVQRSLTQLHVSSVSMLSYEFLIQLNK